MTSVLFDWTRIISALQRTSAFETARQHLYLWDLSQLVEAIALYDSIIVTEQVQTDFLSWRKTSAGHGPFDLTKPHYEELFSEVIQTYPYREVDPKIKELFRDLERSRQIHPKSGGWFFAADIAALPDMENLVRMSDLQYLYDASAIYSDYESQILASMERVRHFLALGSIMGAPYYPIAFREPLVRLLTPGDVDAARLHPYRKFENAVHAYITSIIGEQRSNQLPLIFNIVLRECSDGSPDDILKVALQLRKESDFVRLRELFSQFVNSYGDIDVPAMATADRILASEITRLKKRLSGEFVSPIDLKLKFGLMPFNLSLDIPSLLQRLRDRRMYPALSNLVRLTEQTFRPLVNVRQKVKRVLGLNIVEEDLHKLPKR